MTGPPEGLLYVADFLSGPEQIALLRELRALSYEHDKFRGQRLKRGYAQFGFAYVSTGRNLKQAAPIPDFLRAVIDKARLYCSDADEFNQCIVTHYPPDSGIGWHTDAPRFGEHIIGVSLGADGLLQFRLNGSEDVSYEVCAVSGSMYLMTGAARRNYQHQVPPVKDDRFSLTFRHVATEEHLVE